MAARAVAKRRIFEAMTHLWQRTAALQYAAEVSGGTLSLALGVLRKDGLIDRRWSALGGYEYKLSTGHRLSVYADASDLEVKTISAEVERRVREVVAQELDAIVAELRR